MRPIEYGTGVSRKPAGSGYSRYVGRVGALAVALGVGAAIASMPAVAFADEPGPGGSTVSSSSVADGSASSGADESSPETSGDASVDTVQYLVQVVY